MYQITKHFKSRDLASVWDEVAAIFMSKPIIRSITGIGYSIVEVNRNEVCYQAVSRNKGEPESIRRKDFEGVFRNLCVLESFNTDTTKEIFNKAGIYKKRSPTFALLIAIGALEKIT